MRIEKSGVPSLQHGCQNANRTTCCLAWSRARRTGVGRCGAERWAVVRNGWSSSSSTSGHSLALLRPRSRREHCLCFLVDIFEGILFDGADRVRPDADCERPNEYAGHCVSYAKRCPCPLKARRQALHNQSACLFEATYIVGDATDITSWTILSIDVLARQKVVARHGRCKLRSNALGLAHAHCMEIRLLIIITIGICHNMHVPTIIIRIERLVIHNIHTHCGTRSLIMVRRCCRSIW